LDRERELLLVRSAKAGDGRAFGELCRALNDRAYAFARRLTGCHADAADVLQEAWLRAFEGIGEFDGRARFGTWFFRIVLSVVAGRGRRAGRSAEEPGRGALAEWTDGGAVGDPAERAEFHELRAELQKALPELPVEQRAAFVLVALEGRSYAEAAAVLECPEGTLAWRMAEARRKLLGRLAPYLD